MSNSRIAAIPDHVVPASLVQGVLFAATLLLGFAVVTIAATLFTRLRIDNTIVRVVAAALAVAAVVYLPQHIFGRASARRFIAESMRRSWPGKPDNCGP